jgi:hypothetical protein
MERPFEEESEERDFITVPDNQEPQQERRRRKCRDRVIEEI